MCRIDMNSREQKAAFDVYGATGALNQKSEEER